MANVICRCRLTLGVALVGLGALGLPSLVGADPAPLQTTVVGTTLPEGWELCILQGVGAAVSQANVIDLDAWQLAEGGSTNNTAAYNPFNTGRTTDVNGTSLPAVVSSNGSPAFGTWAAGCAATVATILQPNMAPIVIALKAGSVSPPSVFLADVDKSQWCAPSDGMPCYASEILGGTDALVASLLSGTSALTVYATVQADLGSYVQGVATTAAAQGDVTLMTQDLAVAQAEVTTAQANLRKATRGLRQLAIDEYIRHGVMSVDNLRLFEPSDQSGVLSQKYFDIAAFALIIRYQHANTAVSAALSRLAASADGLTQARSALMSDSTAEDWALGRLATDVTTLDAAGACAGETMTLSTTSVTPTPVPTTNASTTTVPPTTVPATNASTTTVPTTNASTTTVPPTTVPAANATTTTVPGTTVPATNAPTGPPAGDQATATPAALGQLQGCLAALAPPGGQ
jgi:hypothetical protein